MHVIAVKRNVSFINYKERFFFYHDPAMSLLLLWFFVFCILLKVVFEKRFENEMLFNRRTIFNRPTNNMTVLPSLNVDINHLTNVSTLERKCYARDKNIIGTWRGGGTRFPRVNLLRNRNRTKTQNLRVQISECKPAPQPVLDDSDRFV